MKFSILFFSSIAIATILSACAGSSNGENLDVPTNLPPICRDIDFVEQPDMREMCGVRTVRTLAYKNIPQQRYLIKPQETSIVKSSDGKLELRFQNSLPLYLDGPIVDELEFSQQKRLEKLRNTYDYREIYNKGTKRIRVFKIGIPTDKGNTYDFCFRIPERNGNARTRSVAMGNHIEALSCADFNKLIAENATTK